MSAYSKWPDIRLASTLFSRVSEQAKQSSAQTKPAEPSTRKENSHRVDERGVKTDIAEEASEQNEDYGDAIEAEAQTGPTMASDNEGGSPIDMSQVEFGPLEVFNSMPAEPSSDQDGGNEAPEPASSDEPAKSRSKKSKRQNKRKSKRSSALESVNEAAYDMEDQDETAEAPASGEGGDESGAGTKRKRESLDASGGRRRKNRKSHNAATTIDEDDTAAAEATVEENGDNQSGEDTTKEGVEASQGELDTTSTIELEKAAREAWAQHINGSSGQVEAADEGAGEADVSLPDAEQEAGDDTRDQDDSTTTPRPKRTSTRKKAKPTFFDQPQEEIDAAYDLPSPSALPPMKERRAKVATKKSVKKRAPKLSQSMQGGPDDDAAYKSRRHRLQGFTQGRFSDEELERIDRQVKAFADENELSQWQVNDMIQAPGATSAGESHEQLWSRLFAECPDRHRQKVINTTRKRFHNFVARGTWTTEQDAELRQLIEIHGTAWSKLAGLINRHPEDLRDRYRNYIICGDTQRKDPWDEEEKLRLAQIVLETIKQIDELRAMQPNRKDVQGTYEEVIDWQNVSHQMGRTRSRLQCITKWKSMNAASASHLPNKQMAVEFGPQLEAAREQIGDISVQERYRLCLSIVETKVLRDSEIPWDNLVDEEFRTTWEKPTLALLWHRLMKSVPDWHKRTTKDCANYLVDEYNQSSELPDIDNLPVDEDEEVQVLQSVSQSKRAPKKSPRRRQSRKSLSEAMITEAEAEEPEPGAASLDMADQPMEEDLQIDPALIDDTPADMEANPEEVDEYAVTDDIDVGKKATPKKRKGGAK